MKKAVWILLSLGAVVSLVAVLASGFGSDPHAVPFLLEGKPAPDFKASAVMPDVVTPGLCDSDYWRRVRAVGLIGITPYPVNPPSCSLVGRVYDQSPYTKGSVYSAGSTVSVKVYTYSC